MVSNFFVLFCIICILGLQFSIERRFGGRRSMGGVFAGIFAAHGSYMSHILQLIKRRLSK